MADDRLDLAELTEHVVAGEDLLDIALDLLAEATRTLDQQKVNEQYEKAGILVNLDGEVPLDESSHCYKRAEDVVKAVLEAGLARIEYTLWPEASLKGTEESSGARRARKQKNKARDKERKEARGRKGHY